MEVSKSLTLKVWNRAIIIIHVILLEIGRFVWIKFCFKIMIKCLDDPKINFPVKMTPINEKNTGRES